MQKKFKFNRMFGLRFYERFDDTFISILTIIILLFAALIFLNAQIDYSTYQEKAEKIIRHRYKSFVTQLLMEEIKQVEPDAKDIKSIVVAAPLEISAIPKTAKVEVSGEQQNRAAQRAAIAKKVSKNPVVRGILKAPASAAGASEASTLPEVDDYFNDIPVIDEEEIKVPQAALNAMAKVKPPINNLEPSPIDGPPDNLFNYVVRRQGAAYLDVPDQLTREPSSERGYRDPEEIERVVHQYSPMIEYCFRKHTKFSARNRGFIKVAFKVSYEGYVIPESVRIINSTIRNKALEQCIKNYIRHWRAFKPLDESMGIAHVVQKFVFN